jgi:hypothetical protein
LGGIECDARHRPSANSPLKTAINRLPVSKAAGAPWQAPSRPCLPRGQ